MTASARLGDPVRAVIGACMRQVWVSTSLVTVVAAGMSALVAAQYRTTFAEALDQNSIRALADNPAIRTLFGAPLALDDPGGFTVWRTGTPLLVLVAVWALLVGTRISRGEEAAGRWELLAGGRVRLTDLVRACLITLTIAASVIAIAVATALVAAGTDATGALIHAAGMFGTALTFAALGLLAAQLFAARTAAVTALAAVVGTSLLVRMLADGIPAAAWAGWLSPFGLHALSAPYAGNRYAPVVLLIVAGIAAAAAAMFIARRRDLGGGVIALSGTRPPRTRLLGSLTGFALRRALAPTTAWAIGVAVYFGLVGVLIASIVTFLGENPRFAELAADAGFAGLDSATGLAAAMFGLLAVAVGLYAVTRVAVLADDEKARRWTTVYSLPVGRPHVVGAELLVTAIGVVALLLTAALSMWVGAGVAGTSLTSGDALAGALNTAPVAWLGLGAATAAYGWYPRAAAAVGALPVVGGFLYDVLAHSIDAPAWARAVTPFAHLAAVPDDAPEWIATLSLTAVAAALTILGLIGHHRRDLHT
ncbi:polyketide antibiotic transporter [Nocardia puris]|uniref:ABC-2 type transport system permease protein n=1 Tax=Nocardia puris TaxID=208602 RepID=A0A366D9C6_9NOCA|nr:polyketide antibiotic transporter [Nocardia puris]MBF6214038.1 polyketide antibiotic transporter [Nocardia puris]MBF6368679.1 polyketide antibiotic transporter [Nocardia puris]MBF6461580.1 polyketide antibiotic transporter [Nocardia puris]RBO86545.1 ABC-2 type transport system permease protein [Nocardia puris]